MLSDHHLDEFVEKGYLFVEDLVPHTLWKNLQKELLMFLEQDLLTPAA